VSRVTGLLLAVVVVLAGCGSVDPGSGGDAATSTLTPAPVPEERGTDGGRLLAPGLSTRGVFDADALVEAHRAALTDTGFALERYRSVVRPDAPAAVRTLNTVGIQSTVAPNASAYRFTRLERSSREWPIAGTYALIGVWYSEPVVRNRFVNDGRVERYWGQNRAASGGPVRDPTQSGSVRSDLAAVDLRVVGNESANGTTVYRLRGSRIGDPDELVFPPLLSEPRNTSMVARIDERGVVRSYALSFDATFVGDRIRVRRTHRVEVGNVTVGKPGWLSEANASVSGASESADGGSGSIDSRGD
jgi:hypothetical protein